MLSSLLKTQCSSLSPFEIEHKRTKLAVYSIGCLASALITRGLPTTRTLPKLRHAGPICYSSPAASAPASARSGAIASNPMSRGARSSRSRTRIAACPRTDTEPGPSARSSACTASRSAASASPSGALISDATDARSACRCRTTKVAHSTLGVGARWGRSWTYLFQIPAASSHPTGAADGANARDGTAFSYRALSRIRSQEMRSPAARLMYYASPSMAWNHSLIAGYSRPRSPRRVPGSIAAYRSRCGAQKKSTAVGSSPHRKGSSSYSYRISSSSSNVTRWSWSVTSVPSRRNM